MPRPSAEAQVAFLANIQRILSEGQFTATYKYALLLALADIAVEAWARFGRIARRSDASDRREVHRVLLAPRGAIYTEPRHTGAHPSAEY
jgi:hypothetical protein